jgi:hypothetical protein
LTTSAGLGCGFADRSLDGLGEDVPDTGCVFTQDVGVDAQGYSWVAWPRRAATMWTETPARSSVVACKWRRSCSRAWGSGVAGGVADLLYLLISSVRPAISR